MIKIFRDIRQNLLKEYRFGRYLIYALGEIVLVVIGILIALQINNWNQRKSALNQERETIGSLKLEFEKNLIELEGNIRDIQAIKGAGEYLLQYTSPDYEDGTLAQVDSLISMTPRMAVWDPSTYTLSNIKSSGKLATLTNDELKMMLIEWESFYANLLKWFDFYVEGGQLYFTYLEEFGNYRNMNIQSQFDFGRSRFNGSNEALLRERSFENKLVGRISVNGFILAYYEEAKIRLTDIIKACETYED